METAISAEGLRKRYADHEVLSGIDLSVGKGEVLGLLGPNGAGKTTIVRILATLLPHDGGKVTVAGFDLAKDKREIRRRIGLTGQYAAVDELLTGRENLRLIGVLLGLGRRKAYARAEELLEQFELTHAANRQAKTYSGGMRRRLDLAASLVTTPTVLFLDEPTTGLDVTSRLLLWGMVREQVAQGVSVLLTTQYLEEADQLAERVAVINKGGLIAEGTPEELKRKVGGERLEVSVATEAELPAVVGAMTGASAEAPSVDEKAKRVSIPLVGGMDTLASVTAELKDAGVAPVDFAIRRSSMDDVFLALTGQRVEDEEPAAEGTDGDAGPGDSVGALVGATAAHQKTAGERHAKGEEAA
ncbi:ATP-binding cassette domain-containing protein [Streptomyces sp. NPDC018972]|uniref:ATP-binding cassette domain-containing protein n=1 Tax=Streptomyces sp. NPDC018972 TaxID=3365060 RepID=UPI0037950F0E